MRHRIEDTSITLYFRDPGLWTNVGEDVLKDARSCYLRAACTVE